MKNQVLDDGLIWERKALVFPRNVVLNYLSQSFPWYLSYGYFSTIAVIPNLIWDLASMEDWPLKISLFSMLVGLPDQAWDDICFLKD